jgi:transcriptional regulator with XRE-family HTH domain
MISETLHWKLRRVAAGIRQQDVARNTGISISRYSAIERGDVAATELDRQLIENFLPPMAALSNNRSKEISS